MIPNISSSKTVQNKTTKKYLLNFQKISNNSDIFIQFKERERKIRIFLLIRINIKI